MSQAGEQDQPSMPADPPGRVGYGSPPEEHRFKKGRSGNPRGRPRKRAADTGAPPAVFDDLLLARAKRSLTVTENGQPRTVSALEVIERKIWQSAAQGNVHAARLYLELVTAAEQRRIKEHRRRFEKQVEYKHRIAKEIHQATNIGYSPPDPVPHPDDMQVDSKHERIIFNGPADDVEQAEWDAADAKRRRIDTQIDELEAALNGSRQELKKSNKDRKQIVYDIISLKEQGRVLEVTYPTEKLRRSPGFTLAEWRKLNLK